MSKKKLYYVLGGFPVVSQSFLYNQISEVLATDRYEVQILVLNKKKGKVHPVYAQLNALVQYLPSGREQGSAGKAKLILTSFFSLLVRHPLLLLRAMNVSKYGREALNGSYLIRAAQFSRLHPDLYHGHFGTTAKIVADLKDMGAVSAPMICSFHGKDITVYPKLYGKDFYSRLFKTAERFTGNSRFIMGKMEENGCPPARIVKIPMCLNTGDFLYRDQVPPRDVFNILTVGRFVEKKGYEFSLRAVALFKKAGIPFTYHVVGEGPTMDPMIKLATELGIRENVVFEGALMQEQVKAFYNRAHVFLLPSVTAANGDTEGQGLVLQEAQAIGIPIIATLHNGFPDSVIDGVTGFLVPEKDPVALFEKLLLLAKDEGLAIMMGKAGRAFVEENFDAGKIGTALIAEYEKNLLSADKRGNPF
jgi:colanic acid/amylovoran biosynthesis glycosyltransferase